jgi:hypothetical protein
MNEHKPTFSDKCIIATVVELARCSAHHRIIVAGDQAPQHMFELHRQGLDRAVTTAHCGLPRGQYDVALVAWRTQSIKALETTLDWLTHYLAQTGVLVVWVDVNEVAKEQQLRTMLARLSFRIEAGTRVGGCVAVSAYRLDINRAAIAA